MIFAKIEQRRLHALRLPPRLDPVAALLAELPPAISAALDEDDVRLGHRSASGGIGRHGGGCLGSRLLQAVQKIRGALRVRRGAEYCPLVIFQRLDPRSDIGGMVLAHCRREVEVGFESVAAKALPAPPSRSLHRRTACGRVAGEARAMSSCTVPATRRAHPVRTACLEYGALSVDRG
jgi:hypothetical protein